MRKLTIALLMATIAISLFIATSNADVGDSGVFGSTTGTSDGFYMDANTWVGSPFVLNDDANITELHAYINAGGGNIKFFVYTLDGLTCEYGSETINSNGYAWVNLTGVNTVLPSGTYILGYRCSQDDTVCYRSDGNGVNGTVLFNGAWGSLSGFYTNNLLTIYANYTVTSLSTEVTINTISENWITFSALMALSLVCLILAWKSNVPIINFVFGVVTLGTAAYYLGTNIVFAGWINILAVLMASLCMLSGGMRLRET